MNTQQRPTHVSVQLTDCAREDAEAVFEAVCTAFPVPCDTTGHAPGAGGGHPTVWSTTVDVATPGERPSGVRLNGPVTADISGGYQAVGQVRGILEACFAAEDQGSASGDQEMEVRLKLTQR